MLAELTRSKTQHMCITCDLSEAGLHFINDTFGANKLEPVTYLGVAKVLNATPAENSQLLNGAANVARASLVIFLCQRVGLCHCHLHWEA